MDVNVDFSVVSTAVSVDVDVDSRVFIFSGWALVTNSCSVSRCSRVEF